MIESTAPHITVVRASKPCACRSHTCHRVFQFLWRNPAATRKEAARSLGLTVTNVKVTVHRLRMMNLTRRCPECFVGELVSGACQTCGCEPALPVVPEELRFDAQSPTNNLQPGNELGSIIGRDGYGYTALGFTNNGLVVKRWIDRAIEDSLTTDVKSLVMNELKRYYPNEVVTDYAGRLVIKEVAEFRMRYPILATSKNVRKQLALNVMRRLEFLYPFLAQRHLQEVTGLQ